MMLRNIMKGTVLVAVSALLIAAITLLGLFAFVFHNWNGGRNWGAPISEISEALVWNGSSYVFSDDELLEDGCWAMLLNPQGQVVWSVHKPEDVPDTYTVSDVAAFTRWYLNDYPVQCRVRSDGLLVAGSPKGSIWKHDIVVDTQVLLQTPLWFLVFFLLALGSVLALSRMVLGHWFRKSQLIRDTARSNWINGASHDIRTPLSVVMGYAAQLEESSDLPTACRKQASAIRVQSQVIRDLVNDLNLTMRLDYEMQALRKEPIRPEAFLREIGASFLNGGMGAGCDFEIDLPETPLPEIIADPFLLRRAVNNLLSNCVQHNTPGCSIRLGAGTEGRQLVIWVEGGTMQKSASPARTLEEDGGASHGTGLRLVTQIAAAHKGKAVFRSKVPFRCELWLPCKG